MLAISPGEPDHAFEHRLLIGVDPVDQADLLGFTGRHAATGVGEFSHDALGYELAQTRERADVGGHADVYLEDGEVGILRGVAHVAGGDHVDAAADASALNGREHGNATLLQATQASLHVQRAVVEARAVANPRRSGGGLIGDAAAAERSEIHPGTEVRTRGRDDDCTCPGVGVDVLHDPGQIAPERRDHAVPLLRSCQNDMRDMVFHVDAETLVGHWAIPVAD